MLIVHVQQQSLFKFFDMQINFLEKLFSRINCKLNCLLQMHANKANATEK